MSANTGKIKLPKSITAKPNGKFQASFAVKKDVISAKRTIYIGTFDSVDEAVKARDAFIIANYNGVAKGYMPRGISYFKQRGMYQAHLSIEGTSFYIGVFNTIQDAIEARHKFIDSLK